MGEWQLVDRVDREASVQARHTHHRMAVEVLMGLGTDCVRRRRSKGRHQAVRAQRLDRADHERRVVAALRAPCAGAAHARHHVARAALGRHDTVQGRPQRRLVPHAAPQRRRRASAARRRRRLALGRRRRRLLQRDLPAAEAGQARHGVAQGRRRLSAGHAARCSRARRAPRAPRCCRRATAPRFSPRRSAVSTPSSPPSRRRSPTTAA
jgi:hypothetical protein